MYSFHIAHAYNTNLLKIFLYTQRIDTVTLLKSIPNSNSVLNLSLDEEVGYYFIWGYQIVTFS